MAMLLPPWSCWSSATWFCVTCFNSGIAISEELSRWLFVWMVFLGAIVGLREHAHLGVDSLVKMLSPAGRKVCYALSHALMLYASILLTEGSWKQTVLNWDTTAPASGLSVGIFYAAGLVFGVSSIRDPAARPLSAC